jgi:hypothetical protein
MERSDRLAKTPRLEFRQPKVNLNRRNVGVNGQNFPVAVRSRGILSVMRKRQPRVRERIDVLRARRREIAASFVRRLREDGGAKQNAAG